ncbi:MAG: sigma-70 family RNA polymerase sigma factor [Phycisphaerae bacterium]
MPEAKSRAKSQNADTRTKGKKDRKAPTKTATASKRTTKVKAKTEKVESIEKRWERYLKSRDVELRNKLVIHYSHLVHTHAARLSRKLPAQVSYDEICSAAFDGLIEAIEAYDPERKAKFETFCQQRISGAVMDWLRSLDPQSRTVRTFEKQRMLAKEALGADRDFAPTQEELAKRLDMSVDRYDYLCRLSQLGKEIHFSALEPPDDNRNQGASHGWDVRDTRTEDPATSVTRELLTDHLTKGLPREERLVLTLYYFEGMTMAEIGSVLSLSESRVSQIHKDILIRLRHRFSAAPVTELVA